MTPFLITLAAFGTYLLHKAWAEMPAAREDLFS